MDIQEARRRVLDMWRGGYRFEHIEAMIDNAEGLTEEERSAVWLYAWSFAERGHQRYVAKQAMLHAGRRETRTPEYAD